MLILIIVLKDTIVIEKIYAILDVIKNADIVIIAMMSVLILWMVLVLD